MLGRRGTRHAKEDTSDLGRVGVKLVDKAGAAANKFVHPENEGTERHWRGGGGGIGVG